MSKRSAVKRKKKEIKPSVSSRQKQPGKSGPPQFLIDAVDAVNVGEYDKAIDFLKQGIGQDSFTACKGIGDIYLLLNENEKAMEWLEKARQCKPESVDVFDSIGRALVALGRKEEAVERFGKAIKLQKDIKNVHLLVESMQRMGESDRAVEVLEEMLDVNPQRPEVMFELGLLFERTNRLDKAERYYKEVIKSGPHSATYDHLGCICIKMMRMSEAVYYLRKAMELLPDNTGIWNNLAYALIQLGEAQEGVDLLRKVVDMTPGYSKGHSNLLSSLHYLPELDQQMIFEEHKRWGQRYAPISMARTSHDNTVEPERKLRIGYISPDFKRHVVNYYFEPLLDSHNRDVVEVYGYGNVDRPDPTTGRLQKKFDCYRNIRGVNDDAVTRIIEQDKIDILIDLAGHFRNNRLLVLARKPAPVQVTYLGYCDTTGMEAVDYLLTDNVLTPPELQKFYTEQAAYLPGGFVCYTPPENAPDVTPLPAAKKGHVTFGAFTTNLRFNRPLLKVWAEILKLIPNSRLLLGFHSGGDEATQDRYLSQFAEYGVSRERIEISGWKSHTEYIKQYNDVDIVFDTFPENGGTTTCEALWMGVPVISLAGQHQNSRIGLSILSHIGMESFAVETPSEYIAKAVAIAHDPENLMEIRASMRSRMTNSSFCNAKRLAHDVETAYRRMWRRWCREQASECPD
ncbi:MAG: tetratricopeptide repeat protein [Planctomycetes bacterium]|nr:tetratricopeptide repeat protein [Planctomycetota bacterium]